MSCRGSAGHLFVYTMLRKHSAVNHLRCGCGVTLIYITMKGSASITHTHTHRGRPPFNFNFSFSVLMPAFFFLFFFCKRDVDADVLYCGAPAVPPRAPVCQPATTKTKITKRKDDSVSAHDE